MLEFCHISKTFDSDIFKKKFTALEDLSFVIPEGKIIGYLGANGAGKTTSIKIAMDFIRPTNGEIVYGKELGGNIQNAFKHIGYLPERPFFYPHVTGREFCFYLGQLAEQSRSTINEMINKWAGRLLIEHALDREIKKYSKGMLQRLGFLVTIIHRPKLIILDEPLSGLDPIGRKDLKEIIREINSDGSTVFFSSHIVSDVEEVCNNVIFLKNGKIMYSGSIDEIISKNIKSDATITYEESGEVKTVNVEFTKKSETLSNLIQKQTNILSLSHKKPTLEEIFYDV